MFKELFEKDMMPEVNSTWTDENGRGLTVISNDTKNKTSIVKCENGKTKVKDWEYINDLIVRF